MSALSSDHIATLLQPYLAELPAQPSSSLFDSLSLYLDLLVKWNARTNLTAIRDPEAIVCRHFGESLFLAGHLPESTRTVLDLGSGAGFPGVPLHLLRPDLSVTLAESQQKKVAFLRETIRCLGLETRVHAGRAEELANGPTFDAVVLRAVDNMKLSIDLASRLGRRTLVLTTEDEAAHISTPSAKVRLPQSIKGLLVVFSGEA